MSDVYVYDIQYSSNNTVAVSSSNHHLTIYSENLLVKSSFKAHRENINAMEFSVTNPLLLFSCSSDKYACCWDTRMPDQKVLCIKLPDEGLAMSIGAQGNLLAAACTSCTYFYDCRMGGSGKQLASYTDCHTDDIIQLKFHPNNTEMLLSSSEDGLICAYNTSIADPEEAVISVINTDCATRRFGFFGADLEGLYTLSTSETASFWHYPSAQRIAHFPTIRESLGVDYLVDCLYNTDQDTIELLSGRYSGECLLTKVTPEEVDINNSVVLPCSPPQSEPPASGSLSASAEEEEISVRHAATVRCCCPVQLPSKKRLILLTGDEESLICRWDQKKTHKRNVFQQESSSSNVVDARNDSSSQKGKKKKHDVATPSVDMDVVEEVHEKAHKHKRRH